MRQVLESHIETDVGYFASAFAYKLTGRLETSADEPLLRSQFAYLLFGHFHFENLFVRRWPGVEVRLEGFEEAAHIGPVWRKFHQTRFLELGFGRYLPAVKRPENLRRYSWENFITIERYCVPSLTRF